MFKKIAVIVAMLGIVGGAILTPLLSRAQTTVPTTNQKITLTTKGVEKKDGEQTSIWKIQIDTVGIAPQEDGEGTISIYRRDLDYSNAVEISNDPITISKNSGTFTTTFTTLPLAPGYRYSAQAAVLVTSNNLAITIDAQGNVVNTNDDTTVAGAQSSPGNSSLPVCWQGLDKGLDIAGCLSQGVYYALFVPTSFIFSLSGQLLDWAMGFTLDPNSYKGSAATFVESGWKITRDIANILFIFILLITGIGTILGWHGVDAKKTIVMVIVVALLLNFSLFFARIIIDASNILGGIFYNNIGTSDISTTNNPWLLKDVKNISTAIVSKFNPQSLFAQAGTLKLTTQSGVVESNYAGHPPALQFGIISIIMAFINCVGIWVFASVALLFISRVAGLWLAMIFAPLAFISYILPSSASGFMGDMHHSKWWGNLARLAMVVPVFMFFMYLILKFMNTKFIDSALGEQTTTVAILGVVIPLLIIAILLTRARKIALDWSGKVGEAAAKAGTFIAGGAVGALAGGYAMLGRATVGRLAYNAANDEELKNKAASGNKFAQAKLAMSTTLAKSSFDLRNTTAGNQLSKQTGMNLNSGLSFVGMDTKGTDGGYLGQQARKAEKDKKYGDELGYDEHAYKHEEEKIGKEKDKKSQYEDIKIDLQNQIRIEKEKIKQLPDNSPEKKASQAKITAMTSTMALVDKNLRAFDKGGKIYSMNSKGEFLDENGKVTDDKAQAKFENHIGIQTMEKNKERIKEARQKQWYSKLQRQSGKRFADDELDELGNIKQIGKELTPEYIKTLNEDYAKKDKNLSELNSEKTKIDTDVKNATVQLQAAMKMKDQEMINLAQKELASHNQKKAEVDEKLTKIIDEVNKSANKLRKAEAQTLTKNYNGVIQVAKEFGKGFAKGAGAVTATAVGAGMINEAFVPGSTPMIALGAGVLTGMKQAFMDYSGKTNQSHAEGHIPHYHGGHTTYHEPGGSSHDTPSAPSGGGGGGHDDHGHGH